MAKLNKYLIGDSQLKSLEDRIQVINNGVDLRLSGYDVDSGKSIVCSQNDAVLNRALFWLTSKKEDFVDKLVENMGDAVEWYRSQFGEDELARTVRDNNLIDADAVAEEAIDWDGVEHFLASYDGEEIELDDGWYAYRTN